MTGIAGFIAPRHLSAIRDTGSHLIAATDPHDAVGILDSYFPEARYFREFEDFAKDLGRRPVNYLTVCSPNFLHVSHIRLGIESGAHVICEKPLTLNPKDLDALQTLEERHGKRINSILQLRLHPALVALKQSLAANDRHEVVLNYVTPRGQWYLSSWKGDVTKSGGLATNIGIHLFDLVLWLFGGVRGCVLERSAPTHAAGILELERAQVRWSLSIDRRDLPSGTTKPSHRFISVDGRPLEFSEGFTDLHTASYREILNGRGFGLAEVRPSIELTHRLRQMEIG